MENKNVQSNGIAETKNALRGRNKKIKKISPFLIVILVFLLAWTAIFFMMDIWFVMNTFKTTDQYKNFDIGGSLAFPNPFTFENYGKSFVQLESFGYGVPLMVFNSLWRTIGTILVQQLCANAVAYCLAKYKFFGRNAIYWTVIVTMMLPVYGTMPAQLRLYKALQMYDSPMVLLGAIGISGIMIPYSCYKNLSWTYAEAAFIEGAGHFRVFWRIMLPQMVPVITALSVTAFIGGWNDYMSTIVYMPSYPTLATGIYYYQEIVGRRNGDYPVLFAAVIMSVIPVLALFLLFQKTFLSLDISGGLKG